jgi:hypothetical protein
MIVRHLLKHAMNGACDFQVSLAAPIMRQAIIVFVAMHNTGFANEFFKG